MAVVGSVEVELIIRTGDIPERLEVIARQLKDIKRATPSMWAVLKYRLMGIHRPKISIAEIAARRR